MRSSWLSVVRKMTSSRQSPRMSALRHGVAFDPLFEEQPVAVSKVDSDSFSQFHFVIELRSSSSRSGSPSHQIAKLQLLGFRVDATSPFVFQTPPRPCPDAQNS